MDEPVTADLPTAEPPDDAEDVWVDAPDHPPYENALIWAPMSSSLVAEHNDLVARLAAERDRADRAERERDDMAWQRTHALNERDRLSQRVRDLTVELDGQCCATTRAERDRLAAKIARVERLCDQPPHGSALYVIGAVRAALADPTEEPT